MASQPPPDERIVVLLVEDEPLVRMLGYDVLDEAGFEVVEAGDADEALTVLQARSDVRVLFTDVDMPGSMNGFELARTVAERWPAIRVLIVSGKTRPGPGEMPPHGRFIGKPYQPAAVVQQIHEITGLVA